MIAQAKNTTPTDATTISAMARAAKCFKTGVSRTGDMFPKGSPLPVDARTTGLKVVLRQIIVKILQGRRKLPDGLPLIVPKGNGSELNYFKLKQIVDKFLTFSDSKSYILGS